MKEFTIQLNPDGHNTIRMWANFRESIDSHSQTVSEFYKLMKEKEEKYGITCHVIGPPLQTFIEFESEEDMINFILKYS